MLLKFAQHIKRSDPLKRSYKGTVVDNEDPRQLRRIKVNIPAFLEGDSEK